MLQAGKRLFWVVAAAFVAALLVTFSALPPVVASHFDLEGSPNGWLSRPVYTVFMLGIGVLLPLATIGLVHALTRDGPARLNIPERPYWVRPENSPEAVRRVRAYMWWLAGILVGIGLLVHGLILAANRTKPPHLPSGWLLLVLAALLAALGGWTVGWYRLLRAPKAGGTSWHAG